MSSKIIKEIIIMLLVCLVAMLALAIILYKFIPNNKVVPEVIRYSASEDVQDLLEDTVDTQENNRVIMTYEVTSSDLKKYKATKKYEEGRTNPFAKVSEESTEVEGISENNQSSSNAQGSTSESGTKNNSTSSANSSQKGTSNIKSQTTGLK